jgi:GNAT superfamily N-acetyltransferase
MFPAVQGQGLGSLLLAHTLAQTDALGLPAYLEATSDRNVPLYQRHGFEVVDELRVGTCPPITAMLRQPRSLENRCQ